MTHFCGELDLAPQEGLVGFVQDPVPMLDQLAGVPRQEEPPLLGEVGPSLRCEEPRVLRRVVDLTGVLGQLPVWVPGLRRSRLEIRLQVLVVTLQSSGVASL